jgi:hypothetical protein
MAIQIKRSAVASKIPLVADLALGELAINTNDGKLFLKKSVGGVETIVDVTATGSATGTVTSVAALTIGTTGTDLSSTVATNTLTPVITLQVPTASATNRGALSSTDWSTFNGKQAAGTYATGTGTASGANTGDETLATIKTKLGVTTLSGSNTGDQTSVSGASGRIAFADRRSTVQTPAQFGAGADWSFMTNTTDGLSDGGSYHGVMHYQPYTDASGGGAYELGFTDNNNLWLRGSSGALTAWAAWKQLAFTSSNITGTAAGLSTTLAIASGGTNSAATATAGGVGYGTGTAHAYTAVGAAGQSLVSNAASAPSFQTLTLENLPDAWVKKSCGCATTSALTLNTAQTAIDGVTLSATTRVLIKNQVAPAQNGIYTGITTTAWVRALDSDTINEIAGAFVNVDAGTANGGKVFDNDLKSTDTLGTTAMNWSQNVDVGYFTTVGNSFAALTNPSAITFPQINANNTVTAQTAINFRTAIGAQIAGTYATGSGSASGVNTGDQVLPTTLPASDVSAWAKAATKPTYTYTEVGAAASAHTHSYQAADGDLLAIGGLVGTVGLLRKTAADTWTLDTSTFATGSGTASGTNTGDQTTVSGSSGSCTGNAATATMATYHSSPDGDRLSSTKLPTTSQRQVRFDFVGGAQVGSPGSNYAGLMTYAPWTGDTASTGDASYQLAFAGTAANGGGLPVLKIRKGIDSTWNSWYDVVTSASGTATLAANATLAGGLAIATGINNVANQIVRTDANGFLQTGYINSASGNEGNAATPSRIWGTNGTDAYLRSYLVSSFVAPNATALSGDQTSWASRPQTSVANMLGWKNYQNGHVVFDASNSTSPTGSAIGNANSAIAWSATYPTLMGWNGASTYGVRVDSARIADSATNWAGIPAGTAMLFVQTAAPTGWTKSTTHDNKALRVVSGAASSGGSTAFTSVFTARSASGTVDATTLVTSQIPSHTHAYTGPYNAGNTNATYLSSMKNGSGAVGAQTSGATGGNGSHSHGFTGTAMDFAVQYVDVIIATKN